MVQRPFHSLDSLALVVRRGRQRPDGDVGPILVVMEMQQLEIADEDSEMGGSRPGQRFRSRGRSCRVHDMSALDVGRGYDMICMICGGTLSLMLFV